jgi:hypothetical protein
MPSNSNILKKIHLIHKKKVKKTSKNITRKKAKNQLIKSTSNLTPEQRAIVCKTSANTYETFEDKVEELFKKNKINILSSSYNLEKQIIDDLKKAVSPSNVKPNQDYYSYINDRWLSEIQVSEEQKYIVQLDDFRITQHKVLLPRFEQWPVAKRTPQCGQFFRWRGLYAAFGRYIIYYDNSALQPQPNAVFAAHVTLIFEYGIWYWTLANNTFLNKKNPLKIISRGFFIKVNQLSAGSSFYRKLYSHRWLLCKSKYLHPIRLR